MDWMRRDPKGGFQDVWYLQQPLEGTEAHTHTGAQHQVPTSEARHPSHGMGWPSGWSLAAAPHSGRWLEARPTDWRLFGKKQNTPKDLP
jgi:hypothetical protein